MLNEAKAASERIAASGKYRSVMGRLWQIQPLPFHPDLIELCDQAIMETVGVSSRLPAAHCAIPLKWYG